jgi:hypothetical protein
MQRDSSLWPRPLDGCRSIALSLCARGADIEGKSDKLLDSRSAQAGMATKREDSHEAMSSRKCRIAGQHWFPHRTLRSRHHHTNFYLRKPANLAGMAEKITESGTAEAPSS